MDRDESPTIVELADPLTSAAGHYSRSEHTTHEPAVQRALDRLSAVADALQAELALLEASLRDPAVSEPGPPRPLGAEPHRVPERRT